MDVNLHQLMDGLLRAPVSSLTRLLAPSLSDGNGVPVPTATAEKSVPPGSSSRFCPTCFNTLFSSAYTSRIVVSSWRIDPFFSV